LTNLAYVTPALAYGASVARLVVPKQSPLNLVTVKISPRMVLVEHLSRRTSGNDNSHDLSFRAERETLLESGEDLYPAGTMSSESTRRDDNTDPGRNLAWWW